MKLSWNRKRYLIHIFQHAGIQLYTVWTCPHIPIIYWCFIHIKFPKYFFTDGFFYSRVWPCRECACLTLDCRRIIPIWAQGQGGGLSHSLPSIRASETTDVAAQHHLYTIFRRSPYQIPNPNSYKPIWILVRVTCRTKNATQTATVVVEYDWTDDD